MPLPEELFHVFAIAVVIAVVLATIRKDTPRAVAMAALRMFALTIAVLVGISAILYALIRIRL